MSSNAFHKFIRVFVLLMLMVSALWSSRPVGVVYAVQTTYYVKPNGLGSGFCSSWGTACNLQYAINAAHGDPIWVMRGTYTPGSARSDTFQLVNAAKVYGGFAGNETNLSQRNVTLNETILSGEIGVPDNNADNSYHVVTGVGAGSSALLDGFTITGGNSNGDGGGIYNVSGGLSLLNSKLVNNTAAGEGGGLFSSNANLVITSVKFSDNHAGMAGGGISIEEGSLSLVGAAFEKNSAVTSGGGAYVYRASGTINQALFDQNSATLSSGGMVLINSDVSVKNATFFGNTAPYGAGLGVSAGSPTLEFLTLSGNQAGSAGGGLYVEDSGVSLLNSIVWANTAPASPEVLLGSNPEKSNFSDSAIKTGCPTGATQCADILLTNPMLGDLGSYGGTSATLPLLPGSPAIDVIGAGDASCSGSDQRGVARPQGAGCDLGAYESRAFNLSISGDNQTAGVGLPFKNPVVVTLSSSYGDPVDGPTAVFTTPGSGASATPASQTGAVSGGTVSASFTANEIIGAYNATVTIGTLSQNISLYNGPLVTISSAQNPSPIGQPVTINIQVSVPPGTAAGTPTGSVTLTDIAPSALQINGDSSLGSRPLVDGAAAFSLSDLSIGPHTIVASYSGDANYSGTESVVFDQVVCYAIYLPFLRH